MTPTADTTDQTAGERTALARAALDALPGLTWCVPVREDLPDLAALLAQVERHDQNPERTSLDDLQEYWDSPRSRPADDMLLARDGRGRLAAVARAGCNRSITERRGVALLGAVRPDLRGRGVGRRIMAWQLAHARDWDVATREPGFGPLVLRVHAPTAQDDVRHLADRFGLHVVRHFLEMERPFTGPEATLPDVAVPDDVRLCDWDTGRSGEALAVLNSAFRDHWGHADATGQMWQEQLESRTFRPRWTVLAVDAVTDELVGVALNVAWLEDWREDHREGYTDQLGVLRSHRGRGIARALLVESMRRFAADGMDAAALGVDVQNPSGALRLYESLGYRTRASTCVHELVEPGASTDGRSAAGGQHQDADPRQAEQGAGEVPAGGTEAVDHRAPCQ